MAASARRSKVRVHEASTPQSSGRDRAGAKLPLSPRSPLRKHVAAWKSSVLQGYSMQVGCKAPYELWGVCRVARVPVLGARRDSPATRVPRLLPRR